mgnify:CR=1 FL=1
MQHEKRKDNLKRQLHKAVFVVALPYQVCKVCKQQMQLFFKLVVQVAVFLQRRFKWQCVQIFLPCNVALFLQEGSQVFERVCFQQPYYDKLCFKLVVQVAVFFNGVSKWQCVQIFVPCNVELFQQEGSQVF